MARVPYSLPLAALALTLVVGRLAVGAPPLLQCRNTDAAGSLAEALERFESEMEGLRVRHKIPGLSTAVLRNQEVIWARGFGFADREAGIQATPDTPYHLASVTKPFGAMVVLQLVEDGALELDVPAAAYGLDYPSRGGIRLRHLLTHTSNGNPGEEFRYDGDRFAQLGYVIRRAAGRSFSRILSERVLAPLGMQRTAPSPISMGDGVVGSLGIWLDADHLRVYREQAQAYRLDERFQVAPAGCPEFFTPAAGLISTVVDLARFDIALDKDRLLSRRTKELMFSPTVSTKGAELPYGIGWFTQRYRGSRLIWHYGWQPSCASSLYLKLPDEGLTLLLLANSDNLSRPYRLGSGDSLALDSPFALAFYKTFVFEPTHNLRLPLIDWEVGADELVERLSAYPDGEERFLLERELLANRRLFHSVGRKDLAQGLMAVHARIYSRSNLYEQSAQIDLGSEPWPYIPLPKMRHLAALAFLGVVYLPIVVIWPVALHLERRRGRRGSKTGLITPNRGRLVAALAAIVTCSIAAVYALYLASNPSGPPAASGTPLANLLFALAGIGAAFSVATAVCAVFAWRRRFWSVPGRLHYMLLAAGGFLSLAVWVELGLFG